MRTRKKPGPGIVWLLMMFLSGAPAAGVWADDDDGNILDRIFNRSTARSFSGTWDSVTVKGNRHTLKLRQIGNNVTGTYSPGNGKIEDGKIKDGVLRVRWKQDGGKGSARFMLSPDGQMLSGMSNDTDDPDAFGRWWNGVRHTSTSFEGTWNLASSDKGKYTVILQKKSGKISGTFQPGNGEIRDGKIQGDRLSFKWKKEYFEGPAKGEGVFELSDDGQSLSGGMNETEGPNKGKISCTATRVPASFHGIWTWKATETGKDILFNEMGFQQQGDKVNPNDDISGIVVGRTLFLNWGATGLNHNAVLTLNDDGKSFHGIFNWGGDSYKNKDKQNIATQGVLLRPEVAGGK